MNYAEENEYEIDETIITEETVSGSLADVDLTSGNERSLHSYHTATKSFTRPHYATGSLLSKSEPFLCRNVSASSGRTRTSGSLLSSSDLNLSCTAVPKTQSSFQSFLTVVVSTLLTVLLAWRILLVDAHPAAQHRRRRQFHRFKSSDELMSVAANERQLFPPASSSSWEASTSQESVRHDESDTASECTVINKYEQEEAVRSVNEINMAAETLEISIENESFPDFINVDFSPVRSPRTPVVGVVDQFGQFIEEPVWIQDRSEREQSISRAYTVAYHETAELLSPKVPEHVEVIVPPDRLMGNFIQSGYESDISISDHGYPPYLDTITEEDTDDLRSVSSGPEDSSSNQRSIHLGLTNQPSPRYETVDTMPKQSQNASNGQQSISPASASDSPSDSLSSVQRRPLSFHGQSSPNEIGTETKSVDEMSFYNTESRCQPTITINTIDGDALPPGFPDKSRSRSPLVPSDSQAINIDSMTSSPDNPIKKLKSNAQTRIPVYVSRGGGPRSPVVKLDLTTGHRGLELDLRNHLSLDLSLESRLDPGEEETRPWYEYLSNEVWTVARESAISDLGQCKSPTTTTSPIDKTLTHISTDMHSSEGLLVHQLVHSDMQHETRRPSTDSSQATTFAQTELEINSCLPESNLARQAPNEDVEQNGQTLCQADLNLVGQTRRYTYPFIEDSSSALIGSGFVGIPADELVEDTVGTRLNIVPSLDYRDISVYGNQFITSENEYLFDPLSLNRFPESVSLEKISDLTTNDLRRDRLLSPDSDASSYSPASSKPTANSNHPSELHSPIEREYLEEHSDSSAPSGSSENTPIFGSQSGSWIHSQRVDCTSLITDFYYPKRTTASTTTAPYSKRSPLAIVQDGGLQSADSLETVIEQDEDNLQRSSSDLMVEEKMDFNYKQSLSRFRKQSRTYRDGLPSGMQEFDVGLAARRAAYEQEVQQELEADALEKAEMEKAANEGLANRQDPSQTTPSTSEYGHVAYLDILPDIEPISSIKHGKQDEQTKHMHALSVTDNDSNTKAISEQIANVEHVEEVEHADKTDGKLDPVFDGSNAVLNFLAQLQAQREQVVALQSDSQGYSSFDRVNLTLSSPSTLSEVTNTSSDISPVIVGQSLPDGQISPAGSDNSRTEDNQSEQVPLIDSVSLSPTIDGLTYAQVTSGDFTSILNVVTIDAAFQPTTTPALTTTHTVSCYSRTDCIVSSTVHSLKEEHLDSPLMVSGDYRDNNSDFNDKSSTISPAHYSDSDQLPQGDLLVEGGEKTDILTSGHQIWSPDSESATSSVTVIRKASPIGYSATTLIALPRTNTFETRFSIAEPIYSIRLPVVSTPPPLASIEDWNAVLNNNQEEEEEEVMNNSEFSQNRKTQPVQIIQPCCAYEHQSCTFSAVDDNFANKGDADNCNNNGDKLATTTNAGEEEIVYAPEIDFNANSSAVVNAQSRLLASAPIETSFENSNLNSKYTGVDDVDKLNSNTDVSLHFRANSQSTAADASIAPIIVASASSKAILPPQRRHATSSDSREPIYKRIISAEANAVSSNPYTAIARASVSAASKAADSIVRFKDDNSIGSDEEISLVVSTAVSVNRADLRSIRTPLELPNPFRDPSEEVETINPVRKTPDTMYSSGSVHPVDLNQSTDSSNPNRVEVVERFERYEVTTKHYSNDTTPGKAWYEEKKTFENMDIPDSVRRRFESNRSTPYGSRGQVNQASTTPQPPVPVEHSPRTKARLVAGKSFDSSVVAPKSAKAHLYPEAPKSKPSKFTIHSTTEPMPERILPPGEGFRQVQVQHAVISPNFDPSAQQLKSMLSPSRRGVTPPARADKENSPQVPNDYQREVGKSRETLFPASRAATQPASYLTEKASPPQKKKPVPLSEHNVQKWSEIERHQQMTEEQKLLRWRNSMNLAESELFQEVNSHPPPLPVEEPPMEVLTQPKQQSPPKPVDQHIPYVDAKPDPSPTRTSEPKQTPSKSRSTSAIHSRTPERLEELQLSRGTQHTFFDPDTEEKLRQARANRYKAKITKAKKEFFNDKASASDLYKTKEEFEEKFKVSMENVRDKQAPRGPLLERFNSPQFKSHVDISYRDIKPILIPPKPLWDDEYKQIVEDAEKLWSNYRKRVSPPKDSMYARNRAFSTGFLETDVDTGEDSQVYQGEVQMPETDMNNVHRSGQELVQIYRGPKSTDGDHHSRSRVKSSAEEDDQSSTRNQSRARSMDYIMDRRNREAVEPPENELKKVLGDSKEDNRQLSQSELRFKKSRDKIGVPDWYADSDYYRGKKIDYTTGSRGSQTGSIPSVDSSFISHEARTPDAPRPIIDMYSGNGYPYGYPGASKEQFVVDQIPGPTDFMPKSALKSSQPPFQVEGVSYQSPYVYGGRISAPNGPPQPPPPVQRYQVEQRDYQPRPTRAVTEPPPLPARSRIYDQPYVGPPVPPKRASATQVRDSRSLPRQQQHQQPDFPTDFFAKYKDEIEHMRKSRTNVASPPVGPTDDELKSHRLSSSGIPVPVAHVKPQMQGYEIPHSSNSTLEAPSPSSVSPYAQKYIEQFPDYHSPSPQYPQYAIPPPSADLLTGADVAKMLQPKPAPRRSLETDEPPPPPIPSMPPPLDDFGADIVATSTPVASEELRRKQYEETKNRFIHSTFNKSPSEPPQFKAPTPQRQMELEPMMSRIARHGVPVLPTSHSASHVMSQSRRVEEPIVSRPMPQAVPRQPTPKQEVPEFDTISPLKPKSDWIEPQKYTGYQVMSPQLAGLANVPRSRNSRVIEVADTFFEPALDSKGKAKPVARHVTLEEVLDSILGLPNRGAGSVDMSRSNIADDSASTVDVPSSAPANPPYVGPTGPGVFVQSHDLMKRAKSNPNNVTELFKNERLYVRCQYCGKVRELQTARNRYVTCRYCYTYYCARNCRRNDWSYHKDYCTFARVNTLCKEVILKVRHDMEAQWQMSRVARRNYNERGRGCVQFRFMSPDMAEAYLQGGWERLLNYDSTYLYYYTVQDLVDNKKDKNLVSLTRRYNPQAKFILGVCVVADVDECPESPELDRRSMNSGVSATANETFPLRDAEYGGDPPSRTQSQAWYEPPKGTTEGGLAPRITELARNTRTASLPPSAKRHYTRNTALEPASPLDAKVLLKSVLKSMENIVPGPPAIPPRESSVGYQPRQEPWQPRMDRSQSSRHSTSGAHSAAERKKNAHNRAQQYQSAQSMYSSGVMLAGSTSTVALEVGESEV